MSTPCQDRRERMIVFAWLDSTPAPPEDKRGTMLTSFTGHVAVGAMTDPRRDIGRSNSINFDPKQGIDDDESTRGCFGPDQPPPCHRRAPWRSGLGRARRSRGDGPKRRRRPCPDRRQRSAADHETGNLVRQAAVAVLEGSHQCRDCRTGGAGRRGASGDCRDRSERTRALPAG